MIDETEEVLVKIERMSSRDRKRVWDLIFALEPEDTQCCVEAPPPPSRALLEEPGFVSIEQYLQFEEHSLERHEYVAGRIFAMTGGTRAHGRIGTNVTVAISNHLQGGPCTVHMNNMKAHVKIDSDEFCYYPDIVVECGETRSPRWVDEAKLIIEVLSPSTERIDRREKRLTYRGIATLEQYVLIAQRGPEVTVYSRSEGWHPRTYSSFKKAVEFRSIQLSISLDEVYKGVF